MTKQLIILNKGNEIEINNFLLENLDKTFTVYEDSNLIDKSLYPKHEWLSPSDFHENSYLENIEDYSYEVAKTWYLDAQPCNGVMLGEMLSYQLVADLILALKVAKYFQVNILNQGFEKVVIVDDGSLENKIFCSLFGEFNIKLKILPKKLQNKKNFSVLKPFLKRALRRTSVFLHVLNKPFLRVIAEIGPGFKMTRGLDGILFDPYLSYESLINDVVGLSAKRVVIPESAITRKRPLSYYRKLFHAETLSFDTQCSFDNKELISAQLSQLQNLFERISLPPSFLIDKTIELVLKDCLKGELDHLVKDALENISHAEFLINKYKIEATLLPFDVQGLYKAIVLLANNKQLLTMCYQHGVMCRFTNFIPPVSKKILVWDEDSLSLLRSWGVSKERVSIINHSLDCIAKSSEDNRNNKLIKKLNIDEGKKIILFTAQPFVGLSAHDFNSEVNKILFNILSLSNEIEGCTFLIKLHPHDMVNGKYEVVKDLIKKTEINDAILVNEELLELIDISDCVIAETSTCLYEAKTSNSVCVSYLGNKYSQRISPYEGYTEILKSNNTRQIKDILFDLLKNAS